MTFAWTDRDGQRRELNHPQPIVAEIEALAREIDQLSTMIESGDRSTRDRARERLVLHERRFDELLADLERWNGHATTATRAAAADMAEKIRRLPELLVDVTLVVDLFDEHTMLLTGTAGDPAGRDAQLGEPMTDLQARAVAACNAATPLAASATRAEAKAWLDGQARFRRQRGGDGGWFAWMDRNAHAHRLVDPLPIETEMVEISGELAAMRLRLLAEIDPAKLEFVVNKAGALWERMSILQGELERFAREEDARDLTECKAWAADWRAKRSK